MYNKLISLLILIVIFWGMYGFYYYFFVMNKGNLTIDGNVWWYTISLYTEKLKTSFSSECKNKKCELIDIAPFDYTLTVKKDWYKDYSQEIKIEKKKTLTVSFDLEKQLKVTQIEEKKQTENQDKLEKFREISSLQKSYKFFNLDNIWYFYFVENSDNTLTLFHKKDQSEVKIYSWDKINKDLIDIQKVYQTKQSIVISYGDDKHIYHLTSGNIIKIFFPQEISYVKAFWNNYQLINSKGSFIYNTETKKVEYFYTFKDFITYDQENYFWIIYKDEEEKKKNYNLESYKDNLIVKYNFKTKKAKVLESISDTIVKIVNENDEIYFYNDLGNKFLVNNID